MEDLPKNFFEALETAVSEVEKFFVEVTEEFAEMLDEIGKLSYEITEELATDFIAEIEECLNDFADGPVTEIHYEIEELDLQRERERGIDSFIGGYVEPTAEQHPACRGCQNYHGEIHGGNLLVCGMHPYGVEDETCPDWEGYSNSI
jgi:hypothetical protein